ncbi:1,4-alpha-glucan branching enzyme GlgB [compost metagenome]
MIVVCNFTQVVRENYRIGIPKKGNLKEIFNTDAKIYGGSGIESPKPLKIESILYDGRDFSAELILPPLSVTVYTLN